MDSTNPNALEKGGITLKAPGNRGALKLQEFLFICANHWMWFVISIAVCMGCAYIYLKRTAPVYSKSAALLIKNDGNGRSVSTNAAVFNDIGINAGSTSVKDEMAMLSSPDLMRDVVRRLNLNVKYTRAGRFRNLDLYGPDQTVEVSLPDMSDKDYATFNLKLDGNGEYTVTDIKLNGKDVRRNKLEGRLGVPMNTALGRLTVSPGAAYDKVREGDELFITRLPIKAAAAGFSGGLTVEGDEDSYNLVTLSITDTSPRRAEDVLNALIGAYNDRWMKDKRTLADNSSKFIDERVQLLQNELGSVDDDISAFKSANLVPNVEAAASMYLSQASQASMAIKDLRNQEYMAKYIRNYLRNSDNNNKLLPANAGIASPSLSAQITQYNSKILERNSLVSQSSASNPLVNDIDQALTAMRGALVASIDGELVSLGEQIRSAEGLSGSATSKIASNPRQAKYLLSVERQQKVKESLYLYLLQKREENQLEQALTSYNTRIVREADGSDAPIAPASGNIMMLAFVAGLLIPALVLFEREISVHVVRGRRDIKDMKTPLAGELPLHSRKQKFTRPGGNDNPKPKVAVKANSRNSINEAFRVLRTNLEFMVGTTGKPKVIMVISANPGSGKTFVTYNLARSLAIKEKRVIMVDLDMRKASLSHYEPEAKKGVADYLAGRVADVREIVHRVEDCPGLSLIPVGTIPPNPTELLFTDKLNKLIEDLRHNYDYVFLDCPPVEVVADSTIISKYADYTLFVIRAGLLDMSILPVIDGYYEKGTFPGMSMILNGTLNPRNSYARRYGNPYSYGYGYGTNYTYSNEK